ncbi:MAG: tetratricopeptide repeat protein [Clostridia bacterium]|nr:tetratricopeptide repeat protein [Clostridia bacterium]
MSEQTRRLETEDYTDPACPFCADAYLKNPPPLRTIDQGRVLEKLDEILSRADTAGAERHLKYWLADAEDGRDLSGQFTLHGELAGLYRKSGREEESLAHADAALRLADELGIGDGLAGATALINKATALKAFGHAPDAVPLFERAQAILEGARFRVPDKLAGLYNNMALALSDVGRLDEARHYFKKALDLLGEIDGSEPERAVTWLNLANLEEKESGLEAAEQKIAQYLERARALLLKPGLAHDGNYAFVCEKCAPTFAYYGYFLDAKELEERARAIYERT